MSNFFAALPQEMVIEVVSRLDLLSVPSFKVSCKVVNNIVSSSVVDDMIAQDIKKRLEGIIDIANSYHLALKNKDNEEKIFKRVSKKLLKAFNKRSINQNEIKKDVASMFKNVSTSTQYSPLELAHTWIKYAHNLPMSETETTRLASLKSYMLSTDIPCVDLMFQYGDTQQYNKSFISYIQIKFHNTGHVEMCFSMERVVWTTTKPSVHDKVSNIPGAVINPLNKIELMVNDATLTGLGKFIVEVFGKQAYIHDVEVCFGVLEIPGVNICTYGRMLTDAVRRSCIDKESFTNRLCNALS